jgi:excisionase family DNA binding protein
MVEPLTLSTRQAAAFLGVGRNKLLRLLQTKRIKAKDLDGRLRFTTESLREFLDALPDALEAERQAPRAKRQRDACEHINQVLSAGCQTDLQLFTGPDFGICL